MTLAPAWKELAAKYRAQRRSAVRMAIDRRKRLHALMQAVIAGDNEAIRAEHDLQCQEVLNIVRAIEDEG